MKRLILLSLFLFTVSFSYAANKMSMVTYFPVPYVAYSQVSVDQQLDVGLTNTCTMNLGCRESGANLNANTVNLKSGKLELNQGKGILGDKILLGSGLGSGQIQFKNVRIQGGNMQSLNADTMNVKSLQLFNKPFPPCKGKGGSDGQMSWKQLKLKGYSGTDADGELYLVCGALEQTVSNCSDLFYKYENKEECCPGTPYADTVCWTAKTKCGHWEGGMYKGRSISCRFAEYYGFSPKNSCRITHVDSPAEEKKNLLVDGSSAITFDCADYFQAIPACCRAVGENCEYSSSDQTGKACSVGDKYQKVPVWSGSGISGSTVSFSRARCVPDENCYEKNGW